MNLYLVARIVLAGALIYLWRGEIPRELRRFALFVAITVPPPGIMTSHEYRLYLWSPLRVVLWIMAVRASAELFRIATQRATFWWERVNFGSNPAGVRTIDVPVNTAFGCCSGNPDMRIG